MKEKRTKKSPRTLPFSGHEAFEALLREIAPALEERGLWAKTQAGSQSWKGRLPKEGESSKGRRHTIAKLCFYGPDQPAFFGLREQVLPTELLDMDWEVRGVPPRTRATFCGILVDLEAGSAAAEIGKLIGACLPVVPERIDNEAFLAEVEARMQHHDTPAIDSN